MKNERRMKHRFWENVFKRAKDKLDFEAALIRALTAVSDYDREDEFKIQSFLLGGIQESYDEFQRKITSWRNSALDLIGECLIEICEKYDKGNAIVFRMERDGTAKKNRYELTTFIGQKHKAKIDYLTKREMYNRIFETYLDKINSESNIGDTLSALIVAGELEMFQENKELHPKFDEALAIHNIKNIELLAGPLIITNEEGYTNEFLLHLAKKTVEDKTYETKFMKNKLSPFESLYAGYFHCYVVGDTILFELPHEFMHGKSDENHIAIFTSKRIANEIRAFFDRYIEEFADIINITFKGNAALNEVIELFNPPIKLAEQRISYESLEHMNKKILEQMAG